MIKVLIIADSPLARAGLAALLEDSCDVVGQSSSEGEFSTTLEAFEPEVIVWDMGWEADGSTTQLSELRETIPPVVALVKDDENINAVWSAGAKGILPQDADEDTLSSAVRCVAQNLIVIDPTFSDALFPPASTLSTEPMVDVTPRELEVLYLMAEGMANKTIAAQLSISEHTVKFHVNAIMTKLGSQSRTEAVVRAMRLGLIPL